MIRYSTATNGVTEEDVEPLMFGWRRRPTPAHRLDILRRAHGVVLAWDEARLVGFVSAISDGANWAYVTLLEVVPELRGRGIGTELMRHILERYRDVYAIDLICDDDLVPFYERLGMHRLNGMVIRSDAALR